jgi:hypothetical protein
MVGIQKDSSNTVRNLFLFLIGLGNVKVYFYGIMGVSEFFVFAVAPFVFLGNIRKLKKDGFFPFIYWLVALLVALIISSRYNHTAVPYVIKTLAVFYSVFAHYVVFYRLLRNNYMGLGWYYLGGVFALAIAVIFGISPTASVDESGIGYVSATKSLEDMIDGQLFFTSIGEELLSLPLIATYFKTPLIFSALAPIAIVIMNFLVTISGRSSSLIALLTSGFILLGQKSRVKMRRMSKHLFLLFIVFGIILLGFKTVYKYLALSGSLDESVKEKYILQTEKGDSMLNLIMSGRKEFFIGLSAALRRPIIGYGPFPEDRFGITDQFLSKYGSQTEYEYFKEVERLRKGRIKLATHSHIIGAWVHYGIIGFAFYVYFIYIIFRHLRRYVSAIPQWYGYFAILICHYAWDVFFSIFAGRTRFALFVVCLCFAKAIGDGRLLLPYKMEINAREYE